MPQDPLLSILMPCKDMADYVEDAIDSVLSCEASDLELLVLDGASTDGSLPLLRERAEDDDRVVVESRPDDGKYDALNQGLQRVKGDYIGWLNADDVYARGVLDDVLDVLREDPKADIVGGDAVSFIEAEEGRLEPHRQVPFPPGRHLRLQVLEERSFSMNAWFVCRRLLERTGPFRTSSDLYMVCDRDYLIRLVEQRPTLLNLDRDVYHYRLHEASETAGDPEVELEQRRRLCEEWLQRPGLSRDAECYCRNQRALAGLVLARDRLADGDVSAGLRKLAACCLEDPLPVLRSLRIVPKRRRLRSPDPRGRFL